MSHFTRVKTKINSLSALMTALDRLGLPYTIGSTAAPAKVRGYLHQEITAHVSIDLGHGYDLGIVKGEDGNFEIAADWWGIESTGGRTEREVVDEIARAYSFARVEEACKENGWTMEGMQEEDGTVQVVAARWS